MIGKSAHNMVNHNDSTQVLGPFCITSPDSKVHGANMGPIWGHQDPDGPHAGPMNFAILVFLGSQITGVSWTNVTT